MLTNEVIIRKAKLSDVPVFVLHFKEMAKQHLSYDPPWQQHKKNSTLIFRKYISKQVKNPRVAVFVAERNGIVLGHMMCKIGKRPPVYAIDRVGQVGEIFVSKNSRGKGVGTALLKKADEWFISRKLKCAMLQVHVKNMNAQRVYEECGFEYERFQMRKFIKPSLKSVS